MTVDLLNRLAMFVALLLAQVLILNHIHLFDVATPLLYVYFAITFRRNFPRWLMLLWCFVTGLIADVFSNTPGLAAGCMTLVGFVQPYLIELVVPRDSVEDLQASSATLGASKFYLLSVVIVALYCLLFFALEAFNFFNWQQWLERAGGSAVLTMILVLAVESVRSK